MFTVKENILWRGKIYRRGDVIEVDDPQELRRWINEPTPAQENFTEAQLPTLEEQNVTRRSKR